MFYIQTCVYNDATKNPLYTGNPQKVEKLSEGINILKDGQTFQVSDKTILAVEVENEKHHIFFINQEGKEVSDIIFENMKELEVEKIISILSIKYNGGFTAVTTKGESKGKFFSVLRREEEQDIIGETDDGIEILASIHDRP